MKYGKDRCVYCGARCDGRTCAAHRDLEALEASALVNSVGNSVEGGEK